ncbi:MAG: hypothetical protein HY653_00670 [Acidobacteria bacterium]|nr:hypothetical protein [Acidobacteriota bacterium]
MDSAMTVRAWNPDEFHRRVAELEQQGWQTRPETYRITPEMNPETGQLMHLYSIEMGREDPES